MASCVRNICTKNYQILIIGFQVTVENVADTIFETQCILHVYAFLDAFRAAKAFASRAAPGDQPLPRK